ncbi:MFS transporter [Pseudonocardia sp. MH-G8]|uniref:MFS transporter n=1 Tax=Pseudonocardia sp. MH-G8 TaxID=1854588 RepID=UPI0018E9CEF4|nr:MFS transporter [Pseudonocardia sp. MH-G8]
MTAHPVGTSKWWRIGAVLMFGLFVAYLDRSNLSIALPGLSEDMGFAGPTFADTSSWALTAFLFGYLAANLLGGFLTYRIDPKLTLIVTVAVFSTCTLLSGFVDSVGLLIALRVVLGFAEGIYWPQQFRVAKAWFTEREMSKGTAIIQYYGQYTALALGFFLLTPLYDALGWRPLFWITGLAGIVLVIPLYLAFLRSAPAGATPAVPPREPGTRTRMRFADFGGSRFLLLVFSYFSNGMLFWGITLWIPLVIESLGFTGTSRGLLAALPYVLSLVLTVPMMAISDRTGKRVLIASSGLLVGGALVGAIPLVESPVGKLVLICVGMGYFTATFTSNLWAIAVTDLPPHLVGPATGIINGFGAGGGGIVAGFVVGQLRAATGSYLPGFVVLGVVAIIGGLALLAYGRLRPRAPAPLPAAGDLAR